MRETLNRYVDINRYFQHCHLKQYNTDCCCSSFLLFFSLTAGGPSRRWGFIWVPEQGWILWVGAYQEERKRCPLSSRTALYRLSVGPKVHKLWCRSNIYRKETFTLKKTVEGHREGVNLPAPFGLERPVPDAPGNSMNTNYLEVKEYLNFLINP